MRKTTKEFVEGLKIRIVKGSITKTTGGTYTMISTGGNIIFTSKKEVIMSNSEATLAKAPR